MKKINLIITTSTLALVIALSTVKVTSAQTASPLPSDHINSVVSGIGAEVSSTDMVTFETPTAPTSEELQTIADKFNASRGIGNVFLIVHESATMETTANYLAENTDITDQTIVFVSSSTPFTTVNESSSEAKANLEAAITAAVNNKPGIYFCTTAGKVTHYKPTVNA